MLDPENYRLKQTSLLVRLYPELARFANDVDRGVAYRQAFGRVGVTRGIWLLLAVVLLGVAIITYLSMRLHIDARYFTLLPVCLSLIFIMTATWIARSTMRRALREELLRRGIPICINCAYDLTGNVSGRCPECGKLFKLSDWYTPPTSPGQGKWHRDRSPLRNNQ